MAEILEFEEQRLHAGMGEGMGEATVKALKRRLMWMRAMVVKASGATASGAMAEGEDADEKDEAPSTKRSHAETSDQESMAPWAGKQLRARK